MEFDSELEPQFYSSNKKFGLSDLVCHVQEKHQDLLGICVRMHLGHLGKVSSCERGNKYNDIVL